jgi:hypothetical protein
MRLENGMPSLPVSILKEAKGLEDISIGVSCSLTGVGTLSRLGTEAASIQKPDGSVSEGIWHWWTSDSCLDRQTVIARDAMQAGRVARGLDPLPDCPMPDLPGKTCQRKFYPERTLYADGSFVEQSWGWEPSSANRDSLNLVENWNVYFTPDEAGIYATLQSDDYLKALDARTVIAIYYSLLQWQCTGKINAMLQPSAVSPQSLVGKYDSGSQFWLEFWERGLRDRIWMVRKDLRQVRLPDGRLETGLRPPSEISRPPSCTSTTGQIIGYVASALMALTGMPPALQFAINLPNTILGLREMITKMSMAAKIQSALMGVPSPVEKVLMEKASGETKSPTEIPGEAIASSGGFPWLLIAGAAAAVLLS